MKRMPGAYNLSLAVILVSVFLYSSCNRAKPKESVAVTDIEGNSYKTVKIGGQVWMAENLRTTKFNDGSPIPLVTDSETWYSTKEPAHCWYNNDSAAFHRSHGILYNYYTINTGKLCPAGWHVPSREEFTSLIKALDPEANPVRHEISTLAGGMLKSTDTIFWAPPNIGANGKSGFNALPGGCRSYAGNFSMAGSFGYFGATQNESSLALRSATESAFLRDGISPYVGVSVRCIKD